MIVRLERPRSASRPWLILNREGKILRTVWEHNLPGRVVQAGSARRTTYWFATIDPTRTILHDRVPPQNW